LERVSLPANSRTAAAVGSAWQQGIGLITLTGTAYPALQDAFSKLIDIYGRSFPSMRYPQIHQCTAFNLVITWILLLKPVD
jgi:hypothetical protein